MISYRPRNDFVLLESRPRGLTKDGLALPDISGESKEWFVIATGPLVEDLERGDKVLVMGAIGQDVAVLPMAKNLFATKQSNVLLIVEGEDDG